VFLGVRLLETSLATAGAVDSDVREALESLIRTYRTLQSGLYYETRPTNLIAAGIHRGMQEAVEGLRKELAEKNSTPIRDADCTRVVEAAAFAVQPFVRPPARPRKRPAEVAAQRITWHAAKRSPKNHRSSPPRRSHRWPPSRWW